MPRQVVQHAHTRVRNATTCRGVCRCAIRPQGVCNTPAGQSGVCSTPAGMFVICPQWCVIRPQGCAIQYAHRGGQYVKLVFPMAAQRGARTSALYKNTLKFTVVCDSDVKRSGHREISKAEIFHYSAMEDTSWP